ncbi:MULTISPECIES: GTP pyrophosphokinase [unclassified Sporolactobacillus]|uniref:GTP pyrophosphokinase n=1 Tax=unclassified Sporolactobacillus TaxID=2628533 RepID=UPI002367FBAC|nr:GTP pyrophosphokinase family protein [Sporolactobacillus sp. CQH2019]MDD9147262.1 GTP pyrophosphokinase family protein [Sporolactobacillus sp. CQH2019]
MEWDVFLAPYRQAVDELKVKLGGYRDFYRIALRDSPIESVTGRVKPVASILEKAGRRGIPLSQLSTRMQDLAGLRVTCQFVDDIMKVVEMIRSRTDMHVVEEKDYIKEKKESGYRSYHVVVQYPLQTITGEKKILAEIQVRTLAMNFWATIEHSLNYKYQGNIPADVKTRLLRAAEAAFRLDEEMSQIREEILTAQQHFSQKKTDEE